MQTHQTAKINSVLKNVDPTFSRNQCGILLVFVDNKLRQYEHNRRYCDNLVNGNEFLEISSSISKGGFKPTFGSSVTETIFNV